MSTDLFASPTTQSTSTLPAAQVSTLLRAAVPELALGLWSLREVEPLSTVPHGGQRLTSCLVRWTNHCDGRTTAAQLVIKERKQVPRWADRAARLLVAAGRGHGARNRVALPYGVCRPGALVSERVFGHSMRTAVLAADGAPAAQAVGERLADWLVDLQATRLGMPPSTRRGLADALPQLVAVASTVPSASPSSPGLSALGWELQRAAADTAEQEGVVSHGDLHPGNVFLADGDVVAIDWDTAALREPAYDVGYALSQLLLSPLHAGMPLSLGVAAATRFWEAYVERGGVASGDRVGVQAARAFIQSMHFELVTYGNGRADVLDLWPRAALAVLRDGPAGLRELTATTVPARSLQTSAAR